MLTQLQGVHPAQVAGTFYPEESQTLAALVDSLLADAGQRLPVPNVRRPTPKVLIVPHAGYVFSGPVAASGYLQLQRSDASSVKRVVLLGPAHRHGFKGIAASSAANFETPLGTVEVDTQGVADALRVPGVQVLDAAHAREHCLEVHMPFLQQVLAEFTIVPLVVGMTTPEHVRQVLHRLWGGPETLIVISSDLSHFLSASAAEKLDLETARLIEAGRVAELKSQRACGHLCISGVLSEVERQNAQQPTGRLGLERLDLRNSSQMGGNRDRVVGYGAWQIRQLTQGDTVLQSRNQQAEFSPDRASSLPKSTAAGSCSSTAQSSAAGETSVYTPELRTLLLRWAWGAIRQPLEGRGEMTVQPELFPAPLQDRRATFVTLKKKGQLRGCIGTVVPQEPLIASVARVAANAAFRDQRFPPVTLDELPELDLSISILSPAQAMTFTDEADLLKQLRPHVDGLILKDAGRQAVFLPAVWEQLPTPQLFVQRLKQKAGFPATHWSSTLQAERFTVETAG